MMSKERELLKRVISGDDDGDFFISNALLKEIEVALAQPEQEPLTPRQGLTEYKKGYAQAELDSKRKFLSVKQAKDLWETTFKSAVPYYIFDEICVAIITALE